MENFPTYPERNIPQTQNQQFMFGNSFKFGRLGRPGVCSFRGMFGVLLESLVVEPTEGGIGYENTCFPSWWLVEPTPFEKYARVKWDHFPKLG